MGYEMDDRPVNCSAIRAIRSIFESPNWATNLLWLSLAALLQSFFVGQIFLLGYGASLLQARAGAEDRQSPDIDSNRLGDYFMQGLWPLLVNLVASLVLSIVAIIPCVLVVVAILATASAMGDRAGVLSVVVALPLVLVIIVAMVLLLVPVTIRGMLCQDFQKAFDLGWCLNFVKLTGREMVLSAFAFCVLGAGISVLGTAIFCVGAIPAAGLVNGAFMHLMAQWYELFLSRGGEPVEPPVETFIDASIV